MRELLSIVISNEMEERGRRTVVTFLVDNGLITNKTFMAIFKRVLYRKFYGQTSKKYCLLPTLSVLGVFGIFYILYKRNKGDPPDNKTIVRGVYNNRNIDGDNVGTVTRENNNKPTSFSIR